MIIVELADPFFSYLWAEVKRSELLPFFGSFKNLQPFDPVLFIRSGHREQMIKRTITKLEWFAALPPDPDQLIDEKAALKPCSGGYLMIYF